ncbi:MAG: 4Fe-4S binding protein, partial [Nitrososphaerota archaeon]
MSRLIRSIIKIDEEKCDGCGLCIPACAEGAIQIIEGKARLIDERYCDGMGACIKECPKGAITIEQREAPEFDEEAVKSHLQRRAPMPSSCPSTTMLKMETFIRTDTGVRAKSQLSQWPVQLALLPPNAPFFQDAELLVVADCVPFAYASFHEDFLKGRAIVVGCPKLDDVTLYRQKLTQLFKLSNVRSVTVVNM